MNAPASRHTRAPKRAVALPLVALACTAAVVIGWRAHATLDVRPEAGIGYALGIAGLGAMVALLGYSARKRWRVLRETGPASRWLETHMLLGVIGPTLVCFHADFELGSANAAAAFVAMLLVATSGFFGRFVYTRVHRDLHGRRESLRDVERSADASRRALAALLATRARAAALLAAFERDVLETSGAGFGRVVALGRRTRAVRRALLRELRAEQSRGGRTRADARAVEAALRTHLAAMRRLAEFSFYERVLSFWHALHLPLCAILFGAAAIHVIAVHRY